MNASIFNEEVYGRGFNEDLARITFINWRNHPEDENAMPDCPKCPNQTDAYGYCWACNERTVFL